MRRFTVRLILFVLPFITASLLIFALAWTSGEIRPQSWFAYVPYTEAAVFFPAWQRQDIANFKLEMTLLREPEVLILGSSRTLEISSQIFNLQPTAVYNGGIDGNSVNENWDFVQLLAAQNKMPSLLILQLDYPDFNGDSETFRTREINIKMPSTLDDLRQMRQGFFQVGQELFRNPLTFFQIPAEYGAGYQFYGLSALRTGIGYLPDGREYNPHLSPEIIEPEIAAQLDAFARRGRQYEVGQSVSRRDMASLRKILETAQAHSTIVIAYLPPYMSSVHGEMMSSPDFAYIGETKTALNELFAEFGFTLFDFTDINSVGGSDAEFYDTWHGGQLLNLRIFQNMSQNAPEILGEYIDPAQLSEAIDDAENPFYVFFP